MKSSPSPLTPAKYVQPIHFEDLDGKQFERLVFAYHARTDRWLSLEWFGQQGKDKGRDILGLRESDTHKDGESVCVLCANWQKLTVAKVTGDIKKVLASPTKAITKIRVVCGHSVPAGLRDKVKKYAADKGIHNCEIWSGNEFEEMIRANAESLLLRFVQGDPFPDASKDLLLFAWGTVPVDDAERLALLSLAFKRPAFFTPVHQESSLPAFRKAIEDTIQVLQTGIWQTRGNVVIRRLPMPADLDNKQLQKALNETLIALVALRSGFDALVRSGDIEHCKCSDPDCPVYMMKHRAAEELQRLRDDVLSAFRRACPSFTFDAD